MTSQGQLLVLFELCRQFIHHPTYIEQRHLLQVTSMLCWMEGERRENQKERQDSEILK